MLFKKLKESIWRR